YAVGRRRVERCRRRREDDVAPDGVEARPGRAEGEEAGEMRVAAHHLAPEDERRGDAAADSRGAGFALQRRGDHLRMAKIDQGEREGETRRRVAPLLLAGRLAPRFGERPAAAVG